MANISYNNPGTQQTGGGGARLAEFLMQLSDRENKVTNAGKAAEYLRKSLDNPETDSAITDDHWANMGNQDKAAWAQGYQDKQTIGRVQALTQSLLGQEQDRQAQAARYKAQADAADQATGAENTFATAYGRATTPATAQPGPFSLTNTIMQGAVPGSQPTPQDAFNMALKSGVAPEKALSLARGLTLISPNATAKGDDDAPIVAQDFGGGRIGYRKPGSNQFEIKDSGDTKGTDAMNLASYRATAQAHAQRVKQATDAYTLASLPLANGQPNPAMEDAKATRDQVLQDQDDFLSGKSNAGPAPAAKAITDKSGNKWNYTGSMTDPTQDRNPANWQAQ